MLEHAYDERGVRIVAVRVTTTTIPSSTLPPPIHLVVLGQLERERERTLVGWHSEAHAYQHPLESR